MHKLAGKISSILGGNLMDFEVYCDENHPELFSSVKPRARYLMIGSLWLPASLRNEIKNKIWELRKTHNAWGEIKWRKVSRSKLSFYEELIDLFHDYGSELRFRCIAIDHNDFDQSWHNNDHELGFYKFYYQLLHQWILDFNQYQIFCDLKTNRDLTRLGVLKDCLKNSNLSADIKQIQGLPSRNMVLIQLADLFLGIASAKMNNTLTPGGAKEKLVQKMESSLGKLIVPTYRIENKFNIFKINLRGGW